MSAGDGGDGKGGERREGGKERGCAVLKIP